VTRSDRQAYLEEQIARQQRGEPVDVDWVRAELERVRNMQVAVADRTRRNLVWLAIGSAALLLVLAVRTGTLGQRGGGVMALGVLLIGALSTWGLARRRR
jgi:hypothetical protein